jgi:hypothetical protein
MYSYIYITYVLWQHRHIIYNVYYYGTLIYSFTPVLHYKKVQEEDDLIEDWIVCDPEQP